MVVEPVEKDVYSFYLSTDLVMRMRRVNRETGIPLSRLTTDGIMKVLERHEAFRLLTSESRD
jgi:hypothetical protein